MAELTDIIEQESCGKAPIKLSLTEKIGIAVFGVSSLPALAYGVKGINDYLNHSSILPEVIEKIASNGGDWGHITVSYILVRAIGGKQSRKVSNIFLGLVTAYHVFGEIFNSSIAPNLPQILPGTPDPKDTYVPLLCAAGLYLMNKKRVLL